MLESIAGIPVIESNVGGKGILEIERGTWGVAKLILKFGSWCNPTFEIWVYDVIEKLLTDGKVDLRQYELLDEQYQMVKKEKIEILQSVDDLITTTRNKTKAQYECYTDVGNIPIAYIQNLRNERDHAVHQLETYKLFNGIRQQPCSEEPRLPTPPNQH